MEMTTEFNVAAGSLLFLALTAGTFAAYLWGHTRGYCKGLEDKKEIEDFFKEPVAEENIKKLATVLTGIDTPAGPDKGVRVLRIPRAEIMHADYMRRRDIFITHSLNKAGFDLSRPIERLEWPDSLEFTQDI